MTLMKYSGVRNFFLSNINLHIIAKHLCCIRKKKVLEYKRHTNVIQITSPFPQTNLVSSTSTMKMKGIFMIVLACVMYSDATITADIVSAAYDELKTFLNANGKYMGRMVRLSKL